MDPRAAPSGRRSCRLPRASGDGPSRRAFRPSKLSAPPRERGWTLIRLDLERLDAGSPARAGMDPQCRRVGRSAPGLPRASGDGPPSPRRCAQPRRAPPRERGWTSVGLEQPAQESGSPARAGMDPRSLLATGRSAGLPRASGDGPCRRVRRVLRVVAPPRERGWTFDVPCRFDFDQGSPARAGMDPAWSDVDGATNRLPRASGDGPFRGHADAPTHEQLRLPRASGDGPQYGSGVLKPAGAPPRERGWTVSQLGAGRQGRGSPARAGMDPRYTPSGDAVTRLPRASGDGPSPNAASGFLCAAPPRERGWTPAVECRLDGTVGSPARAGMDPCAAPPARR